MDLFQWKKCFDTGYSETNVTMKYIYYDDGAYTQWAEGKSVSKRNSDSIGQVPSLKGFLGLESVSHKLNSSIGRNSKYIEPRIENLLYPKEGDEKNINGYFI